MIKLGPHHPPCPVINLGISHPRKKEKKERRKRKDFWDAFRFHSTNQLTSIHIWRQNTDPGTYA